MNISIAKNKMEELMNDVTGRLLRSKKKYFIVCQNNRGTQYVDSVKDIEFLKRVHLQLGNIIKEVEESK